MRVRRADPHVIGRNADTLLDGSGESAGKPGRHHDDVDRDDCGLDRPLFEDDDPGCRRLPRAGDETWIAGWAVESGEFNADGRCGFDRAASHEEVVSGCRPAEPARRSRHAEGGSCREQRATGRVSIALILSLVVSIHGQGPSAYDSIQD